MIALPSFKRGDTWSLTSTLTKNKNGVDLTGVVIKSQIRTSNLVLVDELQYALADQKKYPGTFVIYPTNPDTNSWPLERLVCDIVFTKNGQVISTETFALPIIEEVTK